MAPQDVLISDVGAHKLWISRLWPTHVPNTVLISNGAAAMGFASPPGSPRGWCCRATGTWSPSPATAAS